QTVSVSSSDNEVGGEARVAHAWDLPFLTIDVGLGAGASLLAQTFTTAGVAPARDTPAGHFEISGRLTVPIAAGFSIYAESAAMTYVFAQDQGGAETLGPWFSFRQIFAVSKEW
ncbi:MAG: hypothetical protein ACREJX_11595, partial [Polyangiaceae bacterium]